MRFACVMLPAVLPIMLLGACAEELSSEDQALRDAEALAAVERANSIEPPLREVVPETILYPDIERHDLFGAACSYAPGTSLGARVIARQADAFMKIDGEIVRFAADPGSRELPLQTRSLYNGREYSLRLQVDGEGVPTASSGEGTGYEGSIHLRDQWDRVVYSGSGSVSCAG
jgi:hypothetical protein